MKPVRRPIYTPPKKSAENDAYAMCVCTRCGAAVSPLDSTLPCPSCGNLTYRKVAADSVTPSREQNC